jgi:hypothetical protein
MSGTMFSIGSYRALPTKPPSPTGTGQVLKTAGLPISNFGSIFPYDSAIRWTDYTAFEGTENVFANSDEYEGSFKNSTVVPFVG